MTEQDQQTLLRFADFMVNASKQEVAAFSSESFPEPTFIERPVQESVVKAIKRLRATYPMLQPETLLHQASDLMAEHVIKGREAVSVIDDLERLFADAYAQSKQTFEQNNRVRIDA